MVKIPVKTVIDYNSKIFVIVSSVCLMLYDVEILWLKEMGIQLENWMINKMYSTLGW